MNIYGISWQGTNYWLYQLKEAKGGFVWKHVMTIRQYRADLALAISSFQSSKYDGVFYEINAIQSGIYSSPFHTSHLDSSKLINEHLRIDILPTG